MVNEFKLTMYHRSFCTPKPDSDLCMRVDLKTRQKKLWKIRPDYYWAAGRWAFGPLGRRAVASRGPRAAGPSGRRAAGPSRAAGRGPLGSGPAFSKTRAHLDGHHHGFSIQISINLGKTFLRISSIRKITVT